MSDGDPHGGKSKIDKMVEYLDKHAESKSKHECASYCRKALEAGGFKVRISSETHAYPNAKDYGPELLKDGATVVPQDKYTPTKGDTAVFDGNSDHPNGHVVIYDGKSWVSDYNQGNNMSPYLKSPPVTIYRLPSDKTE